MKQVLKPSYHGIKFVWDDWRKDNLRTQRITFNSNNRVYYDNFIPPCSKMLVYVLSPVNELQGMYEVTGSYRNSGDPKFDVEVPVSLVCDKTKGLTFTEVKKHVHNFNPFHEGVSYQPLTKSQFDKLYSDLQNKI